MEKATGRKEDKGTRKIELDKFIGVLGKKRTLNGIKYSLPQPKRLKRCFHNIKVIQKKKKSHGKKERTLKRRY